MSSVVPDPMSALGHKRTFAVQKAMSALPLKADMCGASSQCPLCANSGHRCDLCRDHTADIMTSITSSSAELDHRPRGGVIMADKANQPILSRRHVLAGLATAPTLAATAYPSASQPVGPRWTPQQTQAALTDAKGTKLVLLGTAAGPVPGRRPENDFARDAEQRHRLRTRLRPRRHRSIRPHRHSVQRIEIDLHHASSCRPQHRVRPAADCRLDPGFAARRARLRPTAAQTDDRRFHARLQADGRLLGRGPQNEATDLSQRAGSLGRRVR